MTRRICARKASVRMSARRSRRMPLRRTARCGRRLASSVFCSSCWQHGAETIARAPRSTPKASASSVAVSHALSERTTSGAADGLNFAMSHAANVAVSAQPSASAVRRQNATTFSLRSTPSRRTGTPRVASR